MAAEDINPEVRRFISDHVTSVAQLEVLLLLRTNPRQPWSAGQLSRELRVEPAWAQAQLQNLCEHGLLERSEDAEPLFRYQPRTAELEQVVTAVAQAYLLNRVSVIELIYSRPPETIRAFADAFRLRKGRPGG